MSGPASTARRPDDSAAALLGEEIPREALSRLMALSPWRSSLHIAWEWLLIFAAIGLYLKIGSPFLYPLAVVWIGARQHALLILMHDAGHHLLSRDKKWNDRIANLFLAWPFFVSVRQYRGEHWLHHRYPNTEKDPHWTAKRDREWLFPRSKEDLGETLFRDMLGLNIVHQWRGARRFGGRTGRGAPSVGRSLYYAAAFALILWKHLFIPFLLFWLVPLLTWLKFVFRLRSISEHFCFAESETADFKVARTTIPALWERLLVAPKNVSYHLGHHLYPGVPFYHLGKLHRELLGLPEYRQRAHVTTTYWGVLRECVGEAAT